MKQNIREQSRHRRQDTLMLQRCLRDRIEYRRHCQIPVPNYAISWSTHRHSPQRRSLQLHSTRLSSRMSAIDIIYRTARWYIRRTSTEITSTTLVQCRPHPHTRTIEWTWSRRGCAGLLENTHRTSCPNWPKQQSVSIDCIDWPFFHVSIDVVRSVPVLYSREWTMQRVEYSARPRKAPYCNRPSSSSLEMIPIEIEISDLRLHQTRNCCCINQLQKYKRQYDGTCMCYCVNHSHQKHFEIKNVFKITKTTNYFVLNAV